MWWQPHRAGQPVHVPSSLRHSAHAGAAFPGGNHRMGDRPVGCRPVVRLANIPRSAHPDRAPIGLLNSRKQKADHCSHAGPTPSLAGDCVALSRGGRRLDGLAWLDRVLRYHYRAGGHRGLVSPGQDGCLAAFRWHWVRPRRCTPQCALRSLIEAVAGGHPALSGYLLSHPKITFADDVLAVELA